MIFTAPAILLALLLLPLLLWLLRATPPAPRLQNFPAIRLLAGLRPKEETAARTPWWLLALRIAAAGLIVIGVAGPVLHAGGLRLGGSGPVLLVIDDGWASGPDFAARVAAAETVLDRAEREGRPVRLLTTGASQEGAKPGLAAAMPAAALRPVVAALRAKPWPTDRARAATILAGEAGNGPVFFISDGLQGAADQGFAAALARAGNVTELSGALPARLLTAQASPARLAAVLRQTAASVPRDEAVLAETGDGRILARAGFTVPAGSTRSTVTIPLPLELRNQLAALRLAGAPGAGSVALLDEAARRRPVGLLAAGASAETPLLGDLFYVDRALAASTELRRGDLDALLAKPLSMLVVVSTLPAGAIADRIDGWVKAGGLLLRFADPDLAQGADDTLLPAKLLAGDRRLGGAMSWSQPSHLAPFPDGSPFAGLNVPGEVTVSRQVLADPSSLQSTQSWAKLADGTPLVTAARHGEGEIVLFHVTANADWSNLPLSGLFVDMLGRLVQRSVGVASADDSRILPPALSLDGAGVLGAPPPSAGGLVARDLAAVKISPLHPPGFYGSEHDRHALNLGSDQISLEPLEPIEGAARLSLDAVPRETPAGAWLIAAALALLCVDLAISLRLRGLLRPAVAGLLLCFVGGQASAENPALATHLAYAVTGDSDVDAVSKAGLAGLSDYVNARTAAVLGDPSPVVPGRDDLSFYPLLYFPVTGNANASPESVAALNVYMRHGGVIVIDLRGGGASTAGSGAGMAPDAEAALRRVAAGLDIPRLAPLTSSHVLSRAFYLLTDYPGRYEGDTVWVQQSQDRSNDSVSPVIIGSNDWAAAWAQDDDGKPLYAVIPGGPRQRTLAYRFGVNLVMYALTGNYKGDQVHVPAILERLGQ